MPSKLPSYPLRAEQEIFDKMKEIAKANDRTLNQEIVRLMKLHIKEYNASHPELESLNLENNTKQKRA